MEVLPVSAFTALQEELERQPLTVNNYRIRTGVGRSQTFGIVRRRCLPPDYSRQNWLRPYLFKLLTDFADQYVDISWNAITVNQGYKAGPHYDRHNVGDSYLVAFGEYEGGELLLHHDDVVTEYVDVCRQPIITDFSKVLHSVADFQGSRYSLVFYWTPQPDNLPDWAVRKVNDEWRFFRGDQMLTRRNGLPHPLRKLKPAAGGEL